MSAPSDTDRSIEVYIDDCDGTTLLEVLQASLGEYRREPRSSQEEPSFEFYRFADAQLTLHLADSGLSSVWLRGDLPWSSHAALARHLFAHLHKRIVCDPADDYPDVDPLSDLFVQIDDEGERIVAIQDDNQGSDDMSRQP